MANQDLPDWKVEALTDEVLAKRIDLARLGFYRLIGRTASSRNFYFEAVLNLFIAVAQQPLSFAVLRRVNGELRPAFHMSTDKKHQHWFEGRLRSKVFTERDNCFPLFPNFLGNDYCITVWIMHTKIPLRGELTSLIPYPSDVDRKSLAANHDAETFAYVADCARLFFSEPWDGFRTEFAPSIAPAVRQSLEKLEQNHAWVATKGEDRARGANWPPDCEKQISEQRAHIHPNSLKGDWHQHLAKTLGPTMEALEFGMHAVSSILRVRSDQGANQILRSPGVDEPGSNECATESAPTNDDAKIDNIILMYRAFDRDSTAEDLGRHATVDGSYPYNVRMLLPGSEVNSKNSVELFFECLRTRAARLGSLSAAGGENWTYSALIDCAATAGAPPESKLRNAMIKVLDDWFWFKLKAEDGPLRLMELMSSAVGNESRSVADPVFNTGLIHFNPIFEFGGLDRVQLDRLPKDLIDAVLAYDSDNSSGTAEGGSSKALIDKIDTCGGVCKDIRRIVAFYYVCSSMVRGGADEKRNLSNVYSGKNIAAILMPVKIRGSVWAVSLHATLIDPQGPRHLPTWMANFFLMTNQCEILNFVIDRALWDNLERRVTALLTKEIGISAMPRLGGFDGLEASLERVNDKLSGEARLVPFVLPRFSVNWSKSTRPKEDFVNLFPDKRVPVPDSDLVMDVLWKIEKNPFFVARQEWSGKTSRSLEPAIRLGLNHGLSELAALRGEIIGNKNSHGLA